MEYNELNIRDFLQRYSIEQITFCSNPGNAGDAVIAAATYSFFDQHGIRYEIIRHTDIVRDKVIFYAGGGCLVEGKYTECSGFIERNFRQNKEIIILPHTVYGYDNLLSGAGNITIICREKRSYDRLYRIGFPKDRLFLAPDMAFLLSPDDLIIARQKGEGTANCFRTDSESSGSGELPEDNRDISMSWNGTLWHRPEFARLVTHCLANYLDHFETVRTDRLHVAILAAILGKQVVLFSNDYYKVKAVYDYSIRDHFPNVTFVNNDNAGRDPVPQTIYNDLSDQLLSNEPELINKYGEITELQNARNQLNQLYQSRSWKLTAPLRTFTKLLGLNKKS